MSEKIIDETMETRMFYQDVKDITNEWEDLITELSIKEVDYLQIKDKIFQEETELTETVDFKGLYGKNNADVRKAHFKKVLHSEYAIKTHLEVSIEYLKRRISFLKAMTYVKMGMIDI